MTRRDFWIAFVIACAIAVYLGRLNRYASATGPYLHVLDRWTGQVGNGQPQ